MVGFDSPIVGFLHNPRPFQVSTPRVRSPNYSTMTTFSNIFFFTNFQFFRFNSPFFTGGGRCGVACLGCCFFLSLVVSVDSE